MEYKIFINDKGYIETKAAGSFTLDIILEMARKFANLETEIGDHGKKIYSIIDATEVTGFDKDILSLAKNIFETGEFDKAAIFGVDMALQKFITPQMKMDKMKMFKTREEAEAWLAE